MHRNALLYRHQIKTPLLSHLNAPLKPPVISRHSRLSCIPVGDDDPKPGNYNWDATRLGRFMLEGRDWKAVCSFYSRMVLGLSDLEALGLRGASSFRSESAHLEVLPLRSDTALHQRAMAMRSDAKSYDLGGDALISEGSETGCSEGATSSDEPLGGREGATSSDEPRGGGREGATSSDEPLDAVNPMPLQKLPAENKLPPQHHKVPKDKRPRIKRPRITYQVELAYFGPAFCGWMQQPGDVPTVEGAVVAGIRSIIPGAVGRSAVASAGRTDKGVSALAQVFSFHTREDLTAESIASGIEGQAPAGSLRVVSVRRRPRDFHATFAAQWRRYVYLFPLRDDSPGGQSDASAIAVSRCVTSLPGPDRDKSYVDVDVDLVSLNLQELVGKTLDYTAFARDTPPGKTCECTLYSARASIVKILASSTAAGSPAESLAAAAEDGFVEIEPAGGPNIRPEFRRFDGECSAARPDRDPMMTKVLCVELVADRFLRRMVRILMATAIQIASRSEGSSMESLSGSSEGLSSMALSGSESSCDNHESLLRLVLTRDRARTARLAAPALGLCFVGVGYDGVGYDGVPYVRTADGGG